MKKEIFEQQKVIVNNYNDLFMNSDARKYIGQTCLVQKQCKNGKYLVQHPDGSVMAFAKFNLGIFEENLENYGN
jgi:hypothetical protein